MANVGRPFLNLKGLKVHSEEYIYSQYIFNSSKIIKYVSCSECAILGNVNLYTL